MRNNLHIIISLGLLGMFLAGHYSWPLFTGSAEAAHYEPVENLVPDLEFKELNGELRESLRSLMAECLEDAKVLSDSKDLGTETGSDGIKGIQRHRQDPVWEIGIALFEARWRILMAQ